MPEGWERFFAVLLWLLPGGLWCAWWLWTPDWKKVWPVLAAGAWVPVVLLMVLSALAWSMISPSSCNCLGFVTLPNFWWQLGSVSALTVLALFCGWLQGQLGWTPAEVEIEPPAAEPGHGHGHERH
jgi:hypothetical protein